MEAKTKAAKEASASASAGGKAAADVAEKADTTREEAQPRLPTAAPPVPRTSTPDARVSPPKPPPPPAPADAVKTKQPSPGLLATFAAGPLGLGLKNSNGQVKVTSVDAGLTAEAQGVVEGSIVHEVNGQSTQGLDKAGVIKLITAAARPLTIKFTEDETEDMI